MSIIPGVSLKIDDVNIVGVDGDEVLVVSLHGGVADLLAQLQPRVHKVLHRAKVLHKMVDLEEKMALLKNRYPSKTVPFKLPLY